VILFELTNDENHSVYQALAVSNGLRQYDFLHSIVEAATDIGRPYLSEHVIKALNFHAITCLHTNAGEYRPCEVVVGPHTPPQHYKVDSLMEDFVNLVNRNWGDGDPVTLAAFVLWRLNHIHPFINGNGRTARAACYFVLCLHVGHLLPGKTILPELIKREHAAYVAALRAADASLPTGTLDISELHSLLSTLIQEQIQSAGPSPGEPSPAAPAPEPS
jgi:prophage maintenance system killer protein